MVRRATQIANRLKGIPEIVEITGDRILDRDYRTDGWENAPVQVHDADQVMLPTIVVVEGEGVHQLRSPANAEDKGIFVWAFSSKSDDGYNEVDDLMELTKEALLDKQHLPTKMMLYWAASVGPFTANDGCVGRHTFQIVGIPKSRIGA